MQPDLTWLLESQPLMNATQEITLFEPKSVGFKMGNTCNQSYTYPAQPAYRLGKQFEDCVACLLQGAENYHIEHRNLVIQTPARTIGELDLIYQNPRQQVVHLELAIKFYLLRKKGTQLADFIGPAGHDRLDLKWDRLRHHQLPLSQNEEVVNFLTQQKIPLPTHRQLLLTGMLFYAYENWQTTTIEGLNVNPQHQRGWWLTHQELELLQHIYGAQRAFIILPKWHWIGGPRHYCEPQPIVYSELWLRVTADPWPNMVLVYERKDDHQPWQFKNRGLVIEGEINKPQKNPR